MNHPATMRFSDLRLGTPVGPLTYTIDQALAESFDNASNLAEPARTQLLRTGDSVLVHPTFTLTDYSRLIQGAFGSMGSGLHVKQSTQFHQPIPRGQSVVVEGEIVDLYERGGRDYWVLAYAAKASNGDPFVSHTMTASVDRDEQLQPSSSPRAPRPGTKATPQGDPTPALIVLTRPITLDGELQFARQYVTRFDGIDTPAPRNAHTDPDLAKSLGLPDAIGHSSHYYAWCAEIVVAHYGRQFLTGGRMQARFLAPIFPGDQLTATARTTSQEAGDAITVRVTNDAGALVAIAEGSAPR